MARREVIDNKLIDWVRDTEEGVQGDYVVGYRESNYDGDYFETTVGDKFTGSDDDDYDNNNQGLQGLPCIPSVSVDTFNKIKPPKVNASEDEEPVFDSDEESSLINSPQVGEYHKVTQSMWFIV